MNHRVTYIFQPAFPMFVFIDVWRVTPKLRWTINPNIAFLFAFFGMSCMVQASLTAISCTIFVVSKTPSYCSTVIIGMKFCTALRWKGSARKNLLVWIELIYLVNAKNKVLQPKKDMHILLPVSITECIHIYRFDETVKLFSINAMQTGHYRGEAILVRDGRKFF